MLRAIDAHRFRNPGLVLVALGNLPTQGQLAQRQPIWRVAIDFVRRGKNERRLRANFAGGFEKIQGAIRIDREISLRIARRPIVRRLCRSVHNGGDVVAMLPK